MPALFAFLIFLCLVLPLEIRAAASEYYIESYRLQKIIVTTSKRPLRNLAVARACGRPKRQVDKWLACRDRVLGSAAPEEMASVVAEPQKSDDVNQILAMAPFD